MRPYSPVMLMKWMRFALCHAAVMVLLSACATQPADETEAEKTLSGESPEREAGDAVTESSNEEEEKDPGFELLDPSGITAMPDDEDMRPTVPANRQDPVIATPPEEDE